MRQNFIVFILFVKNKIYENKIESKYLNSIKTNLIYIERIAMYVLIISDDFLKFSNSIK